MAEREQAPPPVETDEVADEIADRDRREKPLLTITEIHERLGGDDRVSRKTIQRKVEALVDEGILQKQNFGPVGGFRLADDQRAGVCWACGGMLLQTAQFESERDELINRLSFECTGCDTRFVAFRNPDGSATELGKRCGKGLSLLSWWGRLGEQTRDDVRDYAREAFDEHEPQAEYPEADLRVVEEGLAALDDEQRENPPRGVLPGDELNDSNE